MALKLKFRTLIPALFQAQSPMILTKQGSAYTLSFDAASAPTGPQGAAGPQGASGVGYGGTSTTSLLIANSTTKIFTTQSGLAYQAGAYVRATSRANSANFMEGTVVSYSAVTLTLSVSAIGGSGTFADWNISLAGIPGAVGVASIAGNTGVFTLGNGLQNAANVINIDPSFFPNPFGGRLTPLSATPVLSSDVVGSQNLYYAPDKGKTLLTNTGGVWSLRQFTSSAADQIGLTLALAGSSSWAADSIHDVFAVMDSGTLKLGTRVWDAGMLSTFAQITNNATLTTGTGANTWSRSTIAFDGTLVQNTATGANLIASNSGMANCLGQDWGVGVTKIVSKVVITAASDNVLRNDGPAVMQINIDGSNDGTNWHLIGVFRINASGANGQTFTLPVNAEEVLPCRYHRVNLEGNGTHNLNVAEIQFYNTVAPANGRRLTSHDGIVVNDAIINPMRTGAASTISVAQYEAIFLGTIHIDTATAGQVSCHTTFGPSRTYGVWNAYNQRSVKMRAGINSTVTSYLPVSTQILSACESATAGTTFSMEVLSGMADQMIRGQLSRTGYLNCSGNTLAYEAGIGVDTTTQFSGDSIAYNQDVVGQQDGFKQTAQVTLAPFFGLRRLYAIERIASANTTGMSLFTGLRSTSLVTEFMG